MHPNGIKLENFSLVTNQNLVTDEERAFVIKVAKLPNFREISSDKLASLKRSFENAVTPDPYYVSPVYYGLTGRRGLWTYEDPKGVLIFCLHPNDYDSVVLFPPFSEDPATVLNNFFSHMWDQNLKFQIGRVSDKDADLIADVNKIVGYKAELRDETMLDWAYPVHTINVRNFEDNTKDLTPKKRDEGNSLTSAYAHIRKTLRYVEKNYQKNQNLLTTSAIDFTNRDHRKDVIKLARSWEECTREQHIHRKSYNVSNVSSPGADYFIRLSEMAEHKNLGLQGLFLRVNGKKAGFSIWEVPASGSITANVFASQICDRKLHYLSSFLHRETAKVISLNGGVKACHGGSELEEMDRHKRGLVPEESLPLKSIFVTKAEQRPTVVVMPQDSTKHPPVGSTDLQLADIA